MVSRVEHLYCSAKTRFSANTSCDVRVPEFRCSCWIYWNHNGEHYDVTVGRSVGKPDSDCFTLKMKTTGFSETSGSTHRTKRRHVSEGFYVDSTLPISITRDGTEPRTSTSLSKSLSQAHISARKTVNPLPPNDIYIYFFDIYIQGVPRGMCNTSGECSLC
jgi:hypothetical protein